MSLKERFKYLGKPYRSEEERDAYERGYKEARLRRMGGMARRHATEDTSRKKRGRSSGIFQNFANMGMNVRKNIDREQRGFGAPSFSLGSFGPFDRQHRKAHRKRKQPRIIIIR